MRLGETDLTKIRVPIAIHNNAGVLAPGCVPVVGQLKTSVNGVTWVNAAGTLVNFNDEGYYYQGVVGDASVEGVLCVLVVGVAGFRTEMASEPVIGSSTVIRVPFVIYDTLSLLFPGFVPSPGQLQTSDDGAVFVNAPGVFSEMGFGGYFYTHTTTPNAFAMVRAAAPSILTALAVGSVPTQDCPTGGGGTAPPIITILTPLSQLSKQTPLQFTVVGGSAVSLRRVFVDAHYAGLVEDDMVHNGDRFGADYTGPTNTRISIIAFTGPGYLYTILRDGGWPGSPALNIHAVDTLGNGI